MSNRIDSTIASPELLLVLDVSLARVELLELEDDTELELLLWLDGELELLDWLDRSETLLGELALDGELLDDVSDWAVELLLELVSDAAVELELELLLDVSDATVLLDDDEVSLWAVLLEELLLTLDSSDCEERDDGELLLVSDATVELDDDWLLALLGLLIDVSDAAVLELLLWLLALDAEEDDVSLATVELELLFDDAELVSLARVELLLELFDDAELLDDPSPDNGATIIEPNNSPPNSAPPNMVSKASLNRCRAAGRWPIEIRVRCCKRGSLQPCRRKTPVDPGKPRPQQ